MIERQMQTFFRDYLRGNPLGKNEAYELKMTSGTSIPFDVVKPHQEEALLECENGNFFHKLSDPPVFYGARTRFNIRRPFDCFNLHNVKAYIIVWFYKPRTPKRFIKIPIGKFIEMRDNANRKSFTEEMAREVGKVLKITK